MSDSDSDNVPLSRVRSAVRLRNRAVAEREASRLARPEGPKKTLTLGHASKSKSAVASTPFGISPLMRSSLQAAGKVGENGDEQWCGPFSVARQMIAAREAAREKREAERMGQEQERKAMHPLDEIIEAVEQEKKRKANPSMEWKGKVRDDGDDTSNFYVKRRKRFALQQNGLGGGSGGRRGVASLFSMCLGFIANHFDDVEGLGDGVGSDIRRSICEELVARGKMNGAAFDALAEAGVEALELIDCAEVTQEQLGSALDSLVPSGLRALILNHAGRCFGSKAVNSIISSPACSLFAISIGGAYLLKDEDASALIEATSSTLSSIEFKACPNIGPSFCTSIGENFASSAGNGCLVELSLEDVPLTKECLLTIGSTSDALRQLKSLSLRQIEGVDDDVVSVLLGSTENLEGLDLSNNDLLTDKTLSEVRRCNKSGALRSLQLVGLRNLTSAGLEALFTPNIPGLPNAPKLKKLNVSSCGEEAVTDAMLKLAATASATKATADDDHDHDHDHDGEERRKVSTHHFGGVSSMGGLVDLNLGGSCITDKSMENLAATCASSLRELDISFCPKVTDKGLGFLVSKSGPQLAKIHIWGNAQITDEFLDGHSRVDEGGLEIIGAWMKQSGKRSLR